MAQPTDTAAIEAETQRLTAETARLNSEIARLNAQRALDAATAKPDNRLTDVTSAVSLAEAQRNLATAQTSARIAQEIGEVKSGTYSGSVDLKDKTGTVEARLLATKAVEQAAGLIATKVAGKSSGPIAVVPARSFVSFDTLYLYRLRRTLVENALKAVPLSPAAPAVGPAPVAGLAAAVPAMVSSGLDALGKVLGFLKTDYTIGGIEVAIDEEVVIAAVAGKLIFAGSDVVLPLTFLPSGQAAALNDIALEMQALLALRTKVQQEGTLKKNSISTLDKAIAAEADAAKKAGLTKQVELAKKELEDIDAAVALHDEFVGGLVATKETNEPPLRKILSELLVEKLSDTHTILLVRLEATGGGYLIKKNMWTGLGSMPLYHMGGSAVSYVLFEAKTSKVLSAGTHAVHGGFVKSQNMQMVLNQ